MIERNGGDGLGRYFGKLRPNRTKWAGATNVSGDVSNANDFTNRGIGAYHVRYSIRDYLRDSRYTTLGRHRDG